MKEKIRQHYHWVIGAVLFIELFIFGGTLNIIISIFIKPVTEGLHVLRGSFSLVYVLESITAIISTMFAPKLIARFSYRKCASVLLLVSAAAFFLYSRMESLAGFGVGCVLVGISAGVCSIAGATYVVERWFHRHLGLILGIVITSTSLGGSFISVVVSDIMEQRGWRAGYATLAGAMVVLAVLVRLTIFDSPKEIGLAPYGDYKWHREDSRETVKDLGWPGYSGQQLFQMPVFYFILLGVLLSCMGIYFTYGSVMPHLQDRGFSVQQAASLQGIMFIGFAAAKLLGGEACDRIGARAVTLLCIGCGVISQWMLIAVSAYGAAAWWLVVYSMALPITALTIPLLMKTLFGYRGQDVSGSMGLAMVQAANMIANPIVGMLYDRNGSYVPGYYIGILVDLIAAAVFTAGYVWVKRCRKSMAENVNS